MTCAVKLCRWRLWLDSLPASRRRAAVHVGPCRASPRLRGGGERQQAAAATAADDLADYHVTRVACGCVHALGEGVGLVRSTSESASPASASSETLNPSNVATSTIGSSFFDPRCRHPFVAELPHRSRVIAPRVVGRGGEGPEAFDLRGG